MAKRSPTKALKLFKQEYGGVKGLINAKLGKGGEIVVSTNGNVPEIPKKYHSVQITIMKMRHAS